jgi:2'-5' RNA ligase
MQSQNLYFLAIIPNGKAAGEVTVLKQHIATHYNSRKALRTMPHITLKAPFATAPSQHGNILEWFTNLNLNSTPFVILLNGFGSFANPKNPVIYVKPVATQLLALQQEVITGFRQYFPSIPLQYTEAVFSPHITIAYRDLAFDQFEKAWAAFKDRPYHARFKVNAIFLLQHDGEKWNIIAEKPLETPAG